MPFLATELGCRASTLRLRQHGLVSDAKKVYADLLGQLGTFHGEQSRCAFLRTAGLLHQREFPCMVCQSSDVLKHLQTFPHPAQPSCLEMSTSPALASKCLPPLLESQFGNFHGERSNCALLRTTSGRLPLRHQFP